MTDTQPRFAGVPQSKKVGITLLWGAVAGKIEHEYIIKLISNTTYYKPGDKLSVSEVQTLCQLENCEVTMAGEDIIAAITNTAGAVTGAGGALNLAKGFL